MFTESLLRNGFAYPCYNMYMFYSVHDKPLSSQYMLCIYSTKVKYPRIKRVLEIIDKYVLVRLLFLTLGGLLTSINGIYI
jgi:hypothetical protein